MDEDISQQEYEALAGFRYELRRFLRFSEEAAASAGLSAQHYQALLAIRAAGGSMRVGALAERLLLRPHSATGLVDRMEKIGIVRRGAAGEDRRQVPISITPRGAAMLSSIAAAHRAELRRLRPLLARLLEGL